MSSLTVTMPALYQFVLKGAPIIELWQLKESKLDSRFLCFVASGMNEYFISAMVGYSKLSGSPVH